MQKLQLEDIFQKQGIAFEKDISMKLLTSFKTGGIASFAVYPKDCDEVIFTVNLAKENDIPLLTLGRGTNVLAPDEGFPGIVMVTKERYNSAMVKGNIITASCGASLSSVCLLAKGENLSGMEFAYGIPGTVGGAVLMNAGAFGGEMKDVVSSVTYLNEKNEVVTVYNKECKFSYRSSLFEKNGCFILSADFKLYPGNKKAIEKKMDEILEKRKKTQPLEYPSAGSTFKRPEGYYAAALIEECGLKGLSVGGAEVSQKHAGFVINKNDASTHDISELIEKIKKEVYEKKGVSLETEVKIL